MFRSKAQSNKRHFRVVVQFEFHRLRGIFAAGYEKTHRDGAQVDGFISGIDAMLSGFRCHWETLIVNFIYGL